MEHLKTLCDNINLQEDRYPEDHNAFVAKVHADRNLLVTLLLHFRRKCPDVKSGGCTLIWRQAASENQRADRRYPGQYLEGYIQDCAQSGPGRRT